jgi:amidase
MNPPTPEPAPRLPPSFAESDPRRADLLGRSALGLAAAVRAGEITSAELVELFLSRIERFEGGPTPLGAFVHRLDARARRAAAAADRLRARTRDTATLPPFLGVPIGVKDLHMLFGAPVRMGSRAYRHLYAPFDDLTVRALRRAGFVILGKTSTSELALLPVVETDIHPPTRNPWALEHTSGGSSGGAAAAVAAGLLPVSPGSDGAGSIRIPASTCGLVGFKPGRGAVPNPHAGPDPGGMTAIGPIAHTVEDAAALGDALRGVAPDDPRSWLAACRQSPPPGLRVALMVESPLDVPTTPERAAAARDVAERLAEAGHAVREQPRVPTDLEEFLPVYQRVFARIPVLFPGKLQPMTRWFRDEGRRYTDAFALDTQARLAARATALQGDVDLLISPTSPVTPPRIGAYDHLPPREMFTALAAMGAFTAAWNVTGQPAATVPWGFDAAGLPIGVQITGRLGQDAQVLSVARWLNARRP